MAEFILQQKISRMTLKSYGRIANFRKPEKYTLGAEIQAAEIRMLRLAILANKSRTSKRQHYQFELDAELQHVHERSCHVLAVLEFLRFSHICGAFAHPYHGTDDTLPQL